MRHDVMEYRVQDVEDMKERIRELTEALEIIKDDLEYDISKGKVALGKARQALEVK